jgi:hypothetical protein
MASGGGVEFEKPSPRHGVKSPPATDCSEEECSLAVGAIIGCDSIKSASWMNSAVVIFFDSIEKVNTIVESGVVLRETQTPWTTCFYNKKGYFWMQITIAETCHMS